MQNSNPKSSKKLADNGTKEKVAKGYIETKTECQNAK